MTFSTTYNELSQDQNISFMDRATLKIADGAVKVKNTALCTGTIGAVGFVAAVCFGMAGGAPAAVTLISLVSWYGAKSVADKYVPQAEAMIANLKKAQ